MSGNILTKDYMQEMSRFFAKCNKKYKVYNHNNRDEIVSNLTCKRRFVENYKKQTLSKVDVITYQL